MRIYAVVQGRYGRRIVQNIKDHGPATWTVDVFDAPPRLPAIIDDPAEFLPQDPPPADLLLSLGEEPGVAELIPDLARLVGAQAVLAPIDRSSWLPPGLKLQVQQSLAELGIVGVFPKPLCSLTPSSSGYRRAAESYESPIVGEFARYFGQPRFKVAVDPEARTISDVTVERDACCGCSRFVAERLVGASVDEAEQKAGLLHHHYPCLASMQQEPIDDTLTDTLMHVSGFIVKAAIEEEIRPYKRPAQYYTPPGRQQ